MLVKLLHLIGIHAPAWEERLPNRMGGPDLLIGHCTICGERIERMAFFQ